MRDFLARLHQPVRHVGDVFDGMLEMSAGLVSAFSFSRNSYFRVENRNESGSEFASAYTSGSTFDGVSDVSGGGNSIISPNFFGYF
jgi:hypothetical protein